MKRRFSNGLQLAAVLAAAVASVATSAVPKPECQSVGTRAYAVWMLDGSALWDTSCAQMEAWVSRSGKEGMGVTVRATNRTGRLCPIEVRGAVELRDDRITSASAMPAVALAPGETQYLYLGFAFDSEAAWNAGDVRGDLVVDVSVGGTREPTMLFSMTQATQGNHRMVNRCDEISHTHIQRSR